MKMIGSKKYKNTKRINKLYEQRRNYSKTYMHKASRQIIEYALENECNNSNRKYKRYKTKYAK